MSALNSDRDSPRRDGLQVSIPIAAATIVYMGGMAAINTAGYGVPAGPTASLKVLGVSEAQVDNSLGGAGAANIPVRKGTFRFANSASADLIAQADIGSVCYAVDDQTVAKTSNSGARPVAGTIFDVDTDGVWVKF